MDNPLELPFSLWDSRKIHRESTWWRWIWHIIAVLLMRFIEHVGTRPGFGVLIAVLLMRFQLLRGMRKCATLQRIAVLLMRFKNSAFACIPGWPCFYCRSPYEILTIIEAKRTISVKCRLPFSLWDSLRQKPQVQLTHGWMYCRSPYEILESEFIRLGGLILEKLPFSLWDS